MDKKYLILKLAVLVIVLYIAIEKPYSTLWINTDIIISSIIAYIYLYCFYAIPLQAYDKDRSITGWWVLAVIGLPLMPVLYLILKFSPNKFDTIK